MSSSPHRQGLLDTKILILRRWVDPAELPEEVAISVITLAELSSGPHQVRPNSEQNTYDEHAERARRLDVLQRAEHEFDPILSGIEAARDLRPSDRLGGRRRPKATTPHRSPDDRGNRHCRGTSSVHDESR